MKWRLKIKARVWDAKPPSRLSRTSHNCRLGFFFWTIWCFDQSSPPSRRLLLLPCAESALYEVQQISPSRLYSLEKWLKSAYNTDSAFASPKCFQNLIYCSFTSHGLIQSVAFSFSVCFFVGLPLFLFGCRYLHWPVWMWYRVLPYKFSLCRHLNFPLLDTSIPLLDNII